MSLLKDTPYDGGLGSSIAKTDLINHDHDHEEGTHEGSSKVKQPIYDIRLVHSDGFTRAMSQVKWSIPNPSGSTTVDLFNGPAADLLRQAVKDLRSLYAIEPIFCHF